jgi:hypothetical protein
MGNNLHRYIAMRCLALDKGYDFSVVAPENFKGKDFMNLEVGDTRIPYRTAYHAGRVWVDEDFGMPLWEEKTNYYNPEVNFIEDNTIIDGEFQDERYWQHHEKEVDEWLKVEPIEISDDVCIINFRGGEYNLFPDLFLSTDYWIEGIKMMLEINLNMKFEVHTDDEVLARRYFPDFKVIHDIGINWRSMRYAKYAIIANSSFCIFPRWLRNGVTIAPRYWARHNTKEWSMPQNYYSRFQYI